MREFRETPQTDRGGRATRQNDMAVDIKMAKHTFDLAVEKLMCAPPTLGKLERARLNDEVSSDLDLVRRTLDGVMRRTIR